MIFRNPQLLWLLLLLPCFALIWRWRGVRVASAALVLRLLAVTALVVALADPIVGVAPAPEGPVVVLADQSDSLTAAGRAALRDRAATIAGQSGAQARVLYVGAEVVSGPHQEPPADGPSPTLPDPSASNLAAGLRAARALLPGGGRVVLLSDGLATDADALAEARLAAAAGVRVDVAPVTPVALPEVAVTSVNAPRSLRAGEEFPIEIAVSYAPASGDASAVSARLQLRDGPIVLGDQEVRLAPGPNSFTFRHVAGNPGVMRLQATLLAAEGDTFAENNGGAATAVVNPPPRVLLVAADDASAVLIADALERQGVATSRVLPENLPTRLSDLAPFDGMVLIDVPAASLSLDQMAGVREFVRSEGRGLVAIGGRNAYTLGAYKDTPLEEVLPVTMEPPPRPQRTDIALLLIVDRSASMTAAFGVSKFDMAREAAILATESLRPEDRIGILAFDTGTLWVVPFQQVGDAASLATIQSQISQLPSGGGTDIELALNEGLPPLAQQPASVRHAVLLTDGRSFSNNFGAYQRLVETARASEITLSTIAIGEDSDTVLLEQLSRWGGGRYYFADQPEDIPRLTLLESEIARADPVVEGAMRADLSRPHPIVRDFSPAELPGLGGYVATTAREAAEVVLRSPEEDPLLAVWQYGLGRAVAWTPTAGDPWAGEWTRWAGFERFWAQTVRYTLPEPDSGPIQVRVEQRPGGARLVVDAVQAGGAPLDLAAVNARVTLPDGQLRSFDVRQSAPGRYTQDVNLNTPGAYTVSVVVLRDGAMQQRDIGYVQPVAPEYRLAADPETGARLLAEIADLTGGAVLGDITPAIDAGTAAGPAPLSDGPWPWLLGLALVLWVLEIAVRRGVFVR